MVAGAMSSTSVPNLTKYSATTTPTKPIARRGRPYATKVASGRRSEESTPLAGGTSVASAGSKGRAARRMHLSWHIGGRSERGRR